MNNRGRGIAPRSSILLYSLPRSGSTWIGKILDSHPSTIYRHEPDSVNHISGIPLFPPAQGNQVQIRAFSSYHENVAAITAPKVCGKAPIFPKSYFGTVRLYSYRAMVGVSKLAARVGIDMPIFGVPTKGRDSCLVWKSIESLGRLGLAMTALPDAHGLLLIRHPCGYVASVIRGQSNLKFDDNRDSSEDYGIFKMLLATKFAQEQELTLDALQAMSTEERLAWRWVLANTKAIRDTKDYRRRCLIVIYDEVCANPVSYAKKIFNEVSLPWSSQTEEFILKSIGNHKDSYYGLMKDPTMAANRWKEELRPESIAKILAIAKRSEAGAFFLDETTQYSLFCRNFETH